MPGAQLSDRVHDRVLDRLRTVRRGRLQQPLQDLAALVDHAGGHLGAADVDPDAQARSGNGGQPSTRFFSPFKAPSMMVFSALRLNIPIIGMFTSTLRV